MRYLILGGAAIYRCDKHLFSVTASAAEVRMQTAQGFFRSLLSRAAKQDPPNLRNRAHDGGFGMEPDF